LSECDPARQGKITEIMEIANKFNLTETEFLGSVKILAEKQKSAAEMNDEDLRNKFKM
jgi:hypothetical protein